MGDDEFFDFDADAGWAVGREEGGGDVFGEFFDEAPFAVFAEFEEALGDGEVVDGFGEIVGGGGSAEVEVELEVEEQTLGAGAFFVGDADAVEDFEIVDVDGVHELRVSWTRRRQSGSAVME